MDSEQLFTTKAELPETSSTAVVTMDPESSAPATKASQTRARMTSRTLTSQKTAPTRTAHSQNRPKKKGLSKTWKPYLEQFTLFPKLPIEIRQATWRFTLQPRAVEIAYTYNHGYYSHVGIPVALRVNRDSRNVVSLLYPLCFGSILHQPRIVFNFSMDTLCFDEMIWTELPKFLVSLGDVELKQIQSIAVDRFIDEARK
ncbi:uncharacterized protein K444DRAFT_267463 [Hyaloscypha bicolor E]|uniref:2EXR domain-containing protein n=1 Tax=Hyaloscypha bicolor E TaxID=1095630 RepID=A0A2J6SI32_9HELO|nr:uncharacterized protein K444DRAFT_267463 [Hyaloscypha bicolor E]PMD50390.1 hypothetical protein K444DRAFT_267463 [Hyaloscypha bicolor E]